MHNKESTGQEDTIRRYQRWLRRARNEDLSDLTKMNIIYSAGTDSIGRTVVCVVAKHYNSYVVDRDRMLLHVIDKLDLISNKVFAYIRFGFHHLNYSSLCRTLSLSSSVPTRRARIGQTTALSATCTTSSIQSIDETSRPCTLSTPTGGLG